MRSPALWIALAAALVGLAWAAAMVALDDPCDGAPDCFDERGPMHPALALRIAMVGLVPPALAIAMRRRVRPAWSAGFAFLVAAAMSLPLLAQQLPDDVRVWLVPMLAAWATFVALVVADRRR